MGDNLFQVPDRALHDQHPSILGREKLVIRLDNIRVSDALKVNILIPKP